MAVSEIIKNSCINMSSGFDAAIRFKIVGGIVKVKKSFLLDNKFNEKYI